MHIMMHQALIFLSPKMVEKVLHKKTSTAFPLHPNTYANPIIQRRSHFSIAGTADADQTRLQLPHTQ